MSEPHTTVPPYTAVPPTAADQPRRAELRRSRTDAMAGGVCGGLGEHTGIDPLLWRVGFVTLTLAGGAGIPVYLLLWVLMPPAPLPAGQQPRPVDALADRLHEKLVRRS
ncbi:PspC domain-containing protein [Geodermatophilus sp. SYSU D00758]